MNTSRPPPIRDFASLKQIWGREGKGTSDEPSEPAASARQTSPGGFISAGAQEPTGGKPDPEAPPPDSHLQRLLELAQSQIATLSERQHSLEEQVSRLEQDLVSKETQVERLIADLSEAREQVDVLSARDRESIPLIEREKALAEARAALASDRALFERELDELDDLKRRETEVTARASSLKRFQEELDRREVEVGDLESLRSELIEKMLAAEAVQAGQTKAGSDLRSAKREIKKKTEETETLTSDVEQLKVKLTKLQDRHRILRNEHAQVQSQFTIASETLENTAKELELSRVRLERMRVARDQAKALLATKPDLSITSEVLLRWLAQEATPECVGLHEDSLLGWSGVGSYDRDAFDRLLSGAGIHQYALPHPSITHVVVGRVGWSKEDLLAQIGLRQGQALRVYSQEMLLAALITGRDPLDCDEAEVLDSFKSGHPALEFLAESELEWPSVSVPDTSEIDYLGGESRGVTESPLHALGYKVGDTSSLSQKQRQAILRVAFEVDQLPWVESDEYMAKWGSSRSHQRLWRIAFHLATMLNGRVGRDWRKPQTRRDWLEDLAWLRDEFYTSRRFRFTWPEVLVL